MANTGIGLLDRSLEALEEGATQTVKAVGQQVGVTSKTAAAQTTNVAADAQAPSADIQTTNPADTDTQEMLNALYGSSQPNQPGQPQQSAVQLQTQAKPTEEMELEKTRKNLEQEKKQRHQEQHNEVYFNALNNPQMKTGQKEESVQDKLDREKAEEERKKQMELEDKQKKEEKVKAPSKNSAEHERKLGG